MSRFVLRRVALFIPVLFGTTFLIFAYVHAIPGDPVEAMLGVQANPRLVAEVQARYGLDRPWPEQYLDWLSGLVTGDLGMTVRTRSDIAELIAGRIPATLQLAAGGFIVGLGLAIPMGLLAGSRPGSWADAVVNGVALFGLAIPVFISGTILLLLFTVQWRVLSPGYVPFTEDPLSSLRYMLLPSITLGIAIAPGFIRVIRMVVTEVLREPHIPYSASKGLRPFIVYWRYLLRNVIPRVVVLIGLLVGGLLGGSLFVEVVFNWPGMGRLLVDAVVQREYFLIQAQVLIYAVVFGVVNLAAELLQGILDPRVRER